MTRFLVDEDLSRRIVEALQHAGYEAVHVREVGLRAQSDANVFAYAQAADAVLITADKGFANIVNFPPGTHAGIILLRLPNRLTVAQVSDRLVRAIGEIGVETLAGVLVIVDPHRARIRRTRADAC